MTDTTAPRTAVPLSRPEFQRLVDVFNGFDIGYHESGADFVADLLVHLEPNGLTIVNREAIEPLLALVRAALDVEEWCRSAGARPLGIRHDFLGAADELQAALAALPESVRVAARKPE